jgi:hypothetical protein
MAAAAVCFKHPQKPKKNTALPENTGIKSFFFLFQQVASNLRINTNHVCCNSKVFW